MQVYTMYTYAFTLIKSINYSALDSKTQHQTKYVAREHCCEF